MLLDALCGYTIIPMSVRWMWGFLFLGALLLAAYLRLSHLPDNPGWYTDEGTHLEIARQWQNGRIQYLAITQSTLLFAKLPLFEGLLTWMVTLFGVSMGTLRGLTAVLNLFTIALLAAVTFSLTDDRWLALLAAGLLTIYPQAVLYSRFGFSYNLLSPLLLLAVWGVGVYRQNGRWLGVVVAGTAVGLGMVSDLWMVSLLPVLFCLTFPRNPSASIAVCALAGLPFGLYTLLSLLNQPATFLFDLQFTLGRLSGLSWLEQLQAAAVTVTTLLAQDGWMVLGVVGLWMIRPLSAQRLFLLFLGLPLLILGRTTALHSLGFYYMIPLLPLVVLGVAALLRYGAAQVVATLQPAPRWHKMVSGVTAVLLGLPFFTSTWLMVGQINGRWQTAIDPFLLNGEDAVKTAEFVNQQLQPDDVVITSPGLAWLVNGKVADFQMAVAFTGEATPHMPGNIPPDRWAFDPRYTQARFVVVDNLWYNWAAIHLPAVAAMITSTQQWPLVFRAGQINVYENPHLIQR